MAGTLASLVVRVGADIANFTSDIKRATTLSQRQSQQIMRSFKRMGVGVTAAMGVAINEAVKFEKAMAEVSTLLDDTSGMDNLTESVRQLSMEYGAAPVDTAKALYQIISAGASEASEQMALLHASNKLAIGGVTDVATAADGLTTVLNAYGMEASQAGHVSDLLFVGMKQGKTTIEEMSTSIGAVATIAAQTGVGLDELIAATATLTKSGIATAESMSGIKGVLSAVMKQSPQAVAMAKSLGVEFNIAAIKSKGFAGWLEEVQMATGGSSEKLAKLFGRVEGLTAVMSLGANGAEEYNSILNETANAAGATDEAYAKMSETVGFQLNQLKATGQVLIEVFGAKLLPTVNLVAEALLLFLKPVKGIKKAQEEAAVAAMTLGAALRANNHAAMTAAIEANRQAYYELDRQLLSLNNELADWEAGGRSAGVEAKRLRGEIKRLEREQNILTKGIVAANKALNEDAELTEIVVTATKRYVTVTKESTSAVEDLTSAYDNMIDKYFPLIALEKEYNSDLADLKELLDAGKISQEMYNQATVDAAGAFEDATLAAQGLDTELEYVTVTAKKMYPEIEKTATGVAAVIENSFKRLDDTFQSFWSNMIKDGKFSLSSIKDLFLDTISQMLHAALTQPIVMRIGAAMTGGLASGAANAAGGSIFSGAGGLVNGVGSMWGASGGWMGVGQNAAGALGGIGGYMVGGNTSTGGQIGSAVGGLALGYVGGAIGGIIGGPIGAVVGKALGAFIGGLVGNLVGGLFSSSPRIKAGGSLTGKDLQFFDSALGGTYVGKTKGGMDEQVADFGKAIADFDNALAGFMSDAQVERATSALKSWQIQLKGDAISVEQMLESRFGAILGTFGNNVREYVNQFNGLEERTEALGRFVTALNTVGATISAFVSSNPADMLAKQLDDANKSSTENLAAIGTTLADLFAGFDGTPEMMDEISQLVDARYRGEIEYLTAIDQLVKGIAASIEAQQNRMREAVEGPRSFTELIAEATGLRGTLSGAGSPEEIASIVSQIQSLVDKAFGGLDAEGQALNVDTLTSLLDTVQAAAEDRANVLAQMVVDSGQVLRDQAMMFAESIGAPLDLNIQATQDVTAAVQSQTEILVDEHRVGQSKQDALIERMDNLNTTMQTFLDSQPRTA